MSSSKNDHISLNVDLEADTYEFALESENSQVSVPMIPGLDMKFTVEELNDWIKNTLMQDENDQITGISQTEMKVNEIQITEEGLVRFASQFIFAPGETFQLGDGIESTQLGVILVQLPQITAIEPLSGRIGSTITIKGTFLQAASSASIGNIPADIIADSNTATEIKITVPSGAISAKIGVNTSNGRAESMDSYTVET